MKEWGDPLFCLYYPQNVFSFKKASFKSKLFIAGKQRFPKLKQAFIAGKQRFPKYKASFYCRKTTFSKIQSKLLLQENNVFQN